MNNLEKEDSKLKIGLCLLKIIADKKANDSDNYKVIDSLRKLESASGVSYPIIQKISVGKRNPSFLTIMAILEAFEITLTEFGQYYDAITEKEVLDYKSKIEIAKKAKVSVAKKRVAKNK